MPSLEELAAGADVDADEIEVDFSAATDFEPIPTGRWAAVLTNVEPDVSKKGNPVVVWTFVFENGQWEGNAVNRQMRRSTNTTGKASGITRSVLKGVGHPAPKGDDRIKIKPGELIGEKVWLEVGPQKNNDEYQEIKQVSPRDPDEEFPLAV